MLKCDSKSHHENEKNPPTQRKGMSYLSTILRNIIKKPVRTAAVISSSHQISSGCCIPYALIISKLPGISIIKQIVYICRIYQT